MALFTALYGGYFIYCSRSFRSKLPLDDWNNWEVAGFKQKTIKLWQIMGNTITSNQKNNVVGIPGLTNTKFLCSYIILMVASLLIPPTPIEKKIFSA
jgi:hypothetical protein